MELEEFQSNGNLRTGTNALHLGWKHWLFIIINRKGNGLTLEDVVLADQIFGCEIALQMALSASEARIYWFNFRQAMIEALAKGLM